MCHRDSECVNSLMCVCSARCGVRDGEERDGNRSDVGDASRADNEERYSSCDGRYHRHLRTGRRRARLQQRLACTAAALQVCPPLSPPFPSLSLSFTHFYIFIFIIHTVLLYQVLIFICYISLFAAPFPVFDTRM